VDAVRETDICIGECAAVGKGFVVGRDVVGVDCGGASGVGGEVLGACVCYV